jgi:multidrug efflux pump subunit AcrA (membrane-fusion protein)
MELNSLQKFDPLKAEAAIIARPAMAIKVIDDETQTQALEQAKTVKALINRVELKRKELVAPHNDFVKEVNSYAKEITTDLSKAELYLKGQLSARAAELEKIRQEAARKAEEERRKKEAELQAKAAAEAEERKLDEMFGSDEENAKAQAVQQAALEREQKQINKEFAKDVRVASSMNVSGAKKVWLFELTDLTKVPREFLALDEKKVRAAIKDGAREIAGLRIYEDFNISVRT